MPVWFCFTTPGGLVCKTRASFSTSKSRSRLHFPVFENFAADFVNWNPSPTRISIRGKIHVFFQILCSIGNPKIPIKISWDLIQNSHLRYVITFWPWREPRTKMCSCVLSASLHFDILFTGWKISDGNNETVQGRIETYSCIIWINEIFVCSEYWPFLMCCFPWIVKTLAFLLLSYKLFSLGREGEWYFCFTIDGNLLRINF